MSSGAATTPAIGFGLSESWKVERRHQSFYTGGKFQLSNRAKHNDSNDHDDDDDDDKKENHQQQQQQQQSPPPYKRAYMACWNNGDVCLVDASNGEVLQTIGCDGDEFTSFSLHPSNENELMTASRSSLLLKVWDLSTNKVTKQWKAHDVPVLDMCYDATGTYLATGSVDRSVRVWDVAKGFCTHSFRGHPGMVGRVVFHPEAGRLELVSCSDDGEVRVYDLRTRTYQTLSNHMGAVRGVCFSPDGETMITVGRDNVINVWSIDPSVRRYEHVHTLPAYEQLECVFFLPPQARFPHRTAQCRYFVTGGEKGMIRVWQQTPSVKCVYTCTLDAAAVGGLPATIVHLSLSRGGTQMYVVTGEHNVLVFALPTDDGAWRRDKCLVGFNDEIVDIRCIPRTHHAVVVTNSENVRLFNWRTLDTDLLTGHTEIVLCADVSNDGRFIVTGSKDRTCRVWMVVTQEDTNKDGHDNDDRMPRFVCVATATGHTEAIGGVVWSRMQGARDGHVFMVSASRDRTIKQWSCDQLIHTPPPPPSSSSSPTPLTVLRTVLAHEKDINSVAVSPNDRVIATGSQDKSVKLWNASDLSLIASLNGHRRGVWRVVFSPVDKVLASASGDKTVKLWSMSDYTCLKTFSGHTNSVLNVRFFNKGMQLLSCGSDAVVKLWTIRTNECVASFSDDHTAKVWALDITADDQHMITGGADSVLNVWRDSTVEDRVARAAADAELVLQEQRLSSLLREKEYGEAIRTAIDIDHPRQLYKILAIVAYSAEQYALLMPEYDDMNEPVVHLVDVIKSLTTAQVIKVMRYAREWTTNARKSAVAGRVLQCILQLYTPAQLLTMMSKHGGENLMTGMIGYTERHYQRVNRLMRKAYLIDYTYQNMSLVSPFEDTERQQQQQQQQQQRSRALGGGGGGGGGGGTSSSSLSSSHGITVIGGGVAKMSDVTMTTAMDVDNGDDADADDMDDDDDGGEWASNWS